MTAEPFDCACCHRRIGNTKHFLVGTDEPIVVCGRCILPSATHAVLFPDCRDPWHIDVHDHWPVLFATRATADRLIRHHQGETL